MALDPTKRYSKPPDRSYELPGGPIAENLGEVQVKILADFKRGSVDDQGVGDKR